MPVILLPVLRWHQ